MSKEDFPNRISPELRSRFDYKGRFTRLFDEDKIKYIEFRVTTIVKKYNEIFHGDLGNNVFEIISSKINVSQYHNMRDLNKFIKNEFIKYLDCCDQPDVNFKSKVKTILHSLLPD